MRHETAFSELHKYMACLYSCVILFSNSFFSQALVKQKRDTVKKGTELVEYKEKLATQIEEQEEKLKIIENQVRTMPTF